MLSRLKQSLPSRRAIIITIILYVLTNIIVIGLWKYYEYKDRSNPWITFPFDCTDTKTGRTYTCYGRMLKDGLPPEEEKK